MSRHLSLAGNSPLAGRRPSSASTVAGGALIANAAKAECRTGAKDAPDDGQGGFHGIPPAEDPHTFLMAVGMELLLCELQWVMSMLRVTSVRAARWCCCCCALLWMV
jgi:hypothetical protein